MPEQIDEPGKDPDTPEQIDKPPGRSEGRPPPTPAPFKHTPWQNFIRDLFMMFGPAQTGLPPYATPEEREAWRLANRPEPPAAQRTSTPPPGYRVTEYKDSQGYMHRSLVPITPPPTAGEPPQSEAGGPSGNPQDD